MWFPKPFTRTPRAQRLPARRRLTVEALEDRCLPATVPVAALVADIVPGVAGSNPANFVVVKNTLFFVADDGVHGPELWMSNGTATGTVLLKDIHPGIGGSNLADLTNVGDNSLFFRADDGVHGRELWKSDGTPEGTVLVKDINPGSGDAYPCELTDLDGTLYFVAAEQMKASGYPDGTLWKSDGTEAGTVLVKDLTPGGEISLSFLTNVGGTLYFSANDCLTHDALWKSDGTTAGTVLVKDGFGLRALSELTAVNGMLFFNHCGSLWKSDGTTAGTVFLKAFPSIFSGPDNLTDVGGTLYFSGDDGSSGKELWKSDGTAAGTVLVKDINPGKSKFSLGGDMWMRGGGSSSYPNSSVPRFLTNVNGRLYFAASNATSKTGNGNDLRTSDGTAGTTSLVKDIVPGTGSSAPSELVNVNGLLYFTANDGVHGTELWQSNGTAAGTVMVQDINPGSAGSAPASLVAMSNKLYFSADDGTLGRELWDPPPVLGPLVQVSGTSPFTGSTADNVAGQPGINNLHSEVEPYLAVNPNNPNNAVAAWIQDIWSNGGGRGNVAAVTFDAGATWQQVVIPGLTLVSGGTYQRAADPWLSFAPNGDLYQISLVVDPHRSPGHILPDRSALLVSKSTDGGLTWNSPIPLIQEDTPARFNDKPSLTADPTNSNYVYAVWDQVSKFIPYVRSATKFTRSTDGGQTWETVRTIFESAQDGANIGHQILVRPDGTLIDLFTDMNGQLQQPYQLTVLRSTDKGTTWSGPIIAAQMQPIGPEVFADVAVDPNNGNLYAVWADARFSGFQYNSIAFAMSTDGGFTWSTPIRINLTPDTIPIGSRNAFMPSIAVARDGTVAVTYFDFRNPDGVASGLPTDHWIVRAHPGDNLTNPASWLDEERLTNTSSNLEQAPVRFGENFLGDYQGLAVAGNNFYALWTQPHGSDPASVFFRDPPPAESTAELEAHAPLSEFHEVFSVHGIDVRIADLGSTTLGLASGDTLWPDANAAGWGWFYPTPGHDAEFSTPGNQGKQYRTDLLGVPEHEVAHLLGKENETQGVMAETLAAARQGPGSEASWADLDAALSPDDSPSGAATLLDPANVWVRRR